MPVDLNPNWKKPGDPILLYDDDCMRIQLYNILFFSKNECYYGPGNEIDLKTRNFELLPDLGDELTLRSLGDSIRSMDSRFTLIESKSSITSVGDQFQLLLVVEYDYGKEIIVNETVEVR